jgi:hypothetical protein
VANRISDRDTDRGNLVRFWPGTKTGENISPVAVCLCEPRKERSGTHVAQPSLIVGTAEVAEDLSFTPLLHGAVVRRQVLEKHIRIRS